MECRICLGDDRPNTMLAPCKCRGTSAYIHEHCLRTYMSYYPDRVCRVCREPMRHPWIDLERTFICTSSLLLWVGILVGHSESHLALRATAMLVLTGLILYHAKHQTLTYEATFICVLGSGFLFVADPLFLPQAVFLIVALMTLATICLFIPAQTLILVLVCLLVMVYSLLLLLAVALRTDAAFTSLTLLAIATAWFTVARPGRLNEV